MKMKLLSLLIALVMLLSVLPAAALAGAVTAAQQNALLRRATAAISEEELLGTPANYGALSPYQLQTEAKRVLETDFQNTLQKIEYLQHLFDSGCDGVDSEPLQSLVYGDLWQEFMEIWAQLDYAQFSLENGRATVKSCMEILNRADATQQEKDEAYFAMSEALDSVDQASALCSSGLDGWLDRLQEYNGYIDDALTYNEDLNAQRLHQAETLSEGLAFTDTVSDESFSVLILNLHQTGVNVVDENGQPLKDVRFTVKDHEASSTPTVSAMTSATGAAAADISAFPFNEMGYVQLDASLELSGYRTWYSVGRYVEGGNVLQRDIRLVRDDGTPYIKEVTLRDTDVLYTSETVYVTPKNDLDHELKVYFDPKGTSGTVSVNYVENNTPCTLTLPYSPSTDSVVFTKKWCRDLTVGSLLSVELNSGAQCDKRVLAVTVQQAAVPEPEKHELNIFDCSSAFPGFDFNLKLHDKPWLNNMNFSFAFPFGPLKNIAPKVTMNPDGTYVLGINAAVTTSGDKEDWKLRTDKSWEMAQDYLINGESLLENMQKNGTLKTKPGSNWGKVKGGTMSVGFEAVIHGKATESRDGRYTFRSNMTLAMPFSFSYSYTQYFMAWAIPIHVGAEGGVNGSVGLKWKSTYVSDSHLDYVNVLKFIRNAGFGQVFIQFAPFVKVFAGVGIRGVLGASLQGLFNLAFAWVGEASGDAMNFTWKGDLSLIVNFFLVTVKQSIMTGGKTIPLYDHRKTASALGAADTEALLNSVSPSPALRADTTSANISPNLTGVTASTVTNTGIVYVANNSQDQPIVGWTGFDGIIRSGQTVLLSQIPGTGDKFNPDQYYLYSAKLTSFGDFVGLHMLMAKHSEDVTKAVTQPDGTVANITFPGKTYTADKLLLHTSSGVQQVLGSYSSSFMPSYNGFLTNPDVVITSLPSSTSTYSELDFFYTAFDADANRVFYYSLAYGAAIRPTYDSFSLSDAVAKKGYTLQKVERFFASRLKIDGQYWPCVYALFTDKSNAKHLACVMLPYSSTAPVIAVADTPNAAGITNLTNPDGTSSILDGHILVAESDGRDQYNLVAYVLNPSLNRLSWSLTREDTFCVGIPNPNVQYARVFGTGLLYWTEAGSELTGDGQKGMHLVRGLYFDRSSGTPYLVTRPMTLMTFDGTVYDPSVTTLSDVTLSGSVFGFFGVGQIHGDKHQMIAIRLRQILSAKVLSAMANTPIISQGDPITISLNLCNNGNTPLTAARLKIVDTSNPGANYELIEMNFAHPEQSSVEIHEGAQVVRLTGPAAVSEYETVSSTEDTVMTTSADGLGSVVRFRLLMPEETTGYRVVFSIPKEWGTGEKQLDCSVTGFQVQVSPDSNSGEYCAAACLDEAMEIQTLPEIRLTRSAMPLLTSGAVSGDAEEEPLLLWFDTDGTVPDGDGYDSFETAVSNETVPVMLPGPCLTVDAGYLYEDDARSIQINMESTSAEPVTEIVLTGYLDGSSTPAATLALNPEFAITKAYGLNLVIPQDVLTGGAAADLLTLEIEGVRADGTRIQNANLCDINLNEALSITLQPKDVTLVEPKNQAVFAIAAKGPAPLSYQWEISADGGTTWAELPGENEPSLTYTCASPFNRDSLLRFRCKVTAGDTQTAVSDEAKLYLLPRTGDSAKPSLWLAHTLMSLSAILVFIEKHRRKCRSSHSGRNGF